MSRSEIRTPYKQGDLSRDDWVVLDRLASEGYEMHGTRHWLAVNKAYVRGWMAGVVTIIGIELLTRVIG